MCSQALQRLFKPAYAGLLAVALLMGWLSVSTAQASVALNSVRVWDAPDNTRVVFDVSGTVAHTLFTLKKPDRVVIDLPNVRWNKNNAIVLKKNSPIERVRIAKKTGNQLRIVLDLKEPMNPKSFMLKPNAKYGNRLVVDLELLSHKLERRPKTMGSGSSQRDVVVVIDAGHGGEDPGAIGKKGTREKDVVLRIAKLLKKELDSLPGFRGELTRTGDYFIKLYDRRDMARSKFKGDLFISIHADAFTNPKAHGASVFTLSRKGASSTLARFLAKKENQSDLIGGVSLEDKDDQLAMVLADLSVEGAMKHSVVAGSAVLKEMGTVAKLHKHSVEQAAFAVLKSPDVPSILVETGFISNPGEERQLLNKQYRKKLVASIRRGIVAYFNAHPPPGSYILQRQLSGTTTYRVRSGDTLSGIAIKHGVSVSVLRKTNTLKSDMIRVGQKLTIPKIPPKKAR